jgi:hypothetical protein
MTPFSETALREAFDVVEEIVSLGGYHDDPEAVARLVALPDGLTPVAEETLSVYRAYALDQEQHAALHGPGLRLIHPPITSWTRSRTAARMILRGALSRQTTHRAIVIAQTVSREHLLVDVPTLYRRLGFDDECVESWDLYARWEREVFLKDLPPIDIHAADIIEHADPDDPEAYRPLASERIWIDVAETMAVIDHVSGTARIVDGQAHWPVTTETGHDGLARYDHRHHSWTLIRMKG